MILVDTSVWADHLRAENRQLAEWLQAGEVLCHPFIIGEIALGTLQNRRKVLDSMSDLPSALPATNDDVSAFIEAEGLAGRGIGYVDVHLLASLRLTTGSSLATFDRRLLETARSMSLSVTALSRTEH